MKRLTIFLLPIVVIYVSIGNTTNFDDSIPEYLQTIVPENSVEIISKRSKYAKIFDNNDGTFLAIISTEPMHYRDELGNWINVEKKPIGLEKRSAYVESLQHTKANPSYNGIYYHDPCPDWKVGYQEGWTCRLLPEWELHEIENVVSVTSATVYFTPDDTTTVRSIMACGQIDDKPSTSSAETNYTNVNPNFIIDSIILNTIQEKSYSLTSDERSIIEDNCGVEGGWYAVGYKFGDEALHIYVKFLTYNTLAFYYTTSRKKITTKPQEFNITISVFPNPFNQKTKISYNLEYATNVKLDIYGLNGQIITSLVNGPKSPGTHTVTFDGSELSSGVYFYRFKTNGFNTTGKMILVK